MNALTVKTEPPLPRPTSEEPLPKLAGTPGLTLLRRGTPFQILPTLSPEEVEQARAAAREICASLTPARADEIAVFYEQLSLHYPQFPRSSAESRMVVENWLEDLADYPADLIAEACRRWRRSAEKFFPSPGQLLKHIEPMLKHRQALQRRAVDFLVQSGGL